MKSVSKFTLLAPTILGLLWLILFTNLAFNFHAAMRTNRSDLGQIDQAVWNSSQGRLLENTDAGFVATRLTDHVEPILVLISPIFWLWNDVRALLLLQVFAVAVGAFFVYQLAGCKLIDAGDNLAPRPSPLAPRYSLLALLFVVLYLLTPQLQHAVMTEFHAAPLAVPLLLWAFWAVERGKWWQLTLATILVACVKEEMALLAAGLPVWAIWRIWQGQREENGKKGSSEKALTPPKGYPPPHPLTLSFKLLLLGTLCLAWFAIATFVIVPSYAPLIYQDAQSVYIQRLGDLGNSPMAILKTFFTDPTKVWAVASQPARLNYLWGLLKPFGFLSLLAPELLLLALPLLIANLFSQYPGQYYNEFHYSAPLIPYLLVAAIYGVARIHQVATWLLGLLSKNPSPAFREGYVSIRSQFNKPSRKIVLPTLTLLLAVWLLGWSLSYYLEAGRGPFGGRYDPLVVNDHHRLLTRFIEQIPADASVTATAAVQPHLSHRRYLYQFPLGLDSPVPADWALIDVTTKTSMAPGDLHGMIQAMIAGDWGVMDAADGFLLLRKGEKKKDIPTAFYDFTHPFQAEARAMLDQGRRFACSVDDWARWRETTLTVDGLYSTTTPNQHLFFVRTAGDEVMYDSAASSPPTLLWLTPQLDQGDQALRITTLAHYFPRTWGVLLRNPPGQTASDGLLMSADNTTGLLCTFMRRKEGQLMQLPLDLASSRDWLARLREQIGTPLKTTEATFQVSPDQRLHLRAAVLDRRTWPGDRVDLWLQWEGATWPSDSSVFVHLRQDDQNRAQADGSPRYFIAYPAAQTMQTQGFLNDWRELTIPAEANTAGEWKIVVGLYNSATGQRAEVVDSNGQPIANEVPITNLPVSTPPTPDQTCALLPDSCAAQW